MRYKLKTKVENGVLKIDSRPHRADRRKTVYLVMDENKRVMEVDKKWVVENINNIVNVGLSGNSLYCLSKKLGMGGDWKINKTLNKSNKSTTTEINKTAQEKVDKKTIHFCTLFWNVSFTISLEDEEDERFSCCYVYRGTFQDLIAGLKKYSSHYSYFKNMTYKFVSEGIFKKPCYEVCIPNDSKVGDLTLYVTEYTVDSDKIYDCYTETLTGKPFWTNEVIRLYHNVFKSEESANQWLDEKILEGKKIVANYVDGKIDDLKTSYRTWDCSYMLSYANYCNIGAVNTDTDWRGYVRANKDIYDLNSEEVKIKNIVYHIVSSLYSDSPYDAEYLYVEGVPDIE